MAARCAGRVLAGQERTIVNDFGTERHQPKKGISSAVLFFQFDFGRHLKARGLCCKRSPHLISASSTSPMQSGLADTSVFSYLDALFTHFPIDD